ncbi:hypothetical protein ACVINI_003201 [Rhizobium beringeri]
MGLRGPGVGRSQTLTPRLDHQLSFLGSQKAARPLPAPKRTFSLSKDKAAMPPIMVIEPPVAVAAKRTSRSDNAGRSCAKSRHSAQWG